MLKIKDHYFGKLSLIKDEFATFWQTTFKPNDTLSNDIGQMTFRQVHFGQMTFGQMTFGQMTFLS